MLVIAILTPSWPWETVSVAVFLLCFGTSGSLQLTLTPGFLRFWYLWVSMHHSRRMCQTEISNLTFAYSCNHHPRSAGTAKMPGSFFHSYWKTMAVISSNFPPSTLCLPPTNEFSQCNPEGLPTVIYLSSKCPFLLGTKTKFSFK